MWSIPATEIGFEGAGGSWSTPALYGDYVYFTTAAGRVLEVERSTGRIVWQLQIGAPAIASPVVVDGTLLQGDCSGHLYAWDVSDPTVPPPLRWSLDLGDCIESTPAVWQGWLYSGPGKGSSTGSPTRARPSPSRPPRSAEHLGELRPDVARPPDGYDHGEHGEGDHRRHEDLGA